MPKALKIEMISDVICPWCMIGLRELERALARMGDAVEANFHFQPYELDPARPLEGISIGEIYKSRFGKTYAEMAEQRAHVSDRAANVGFTMNMTENSRIYNTFDAHRLLHWAELQGKQLALKHALFAAHFTDGRNISDYDTLADIASSVGLDAGEAGKVLMDGIYADDVRRAEQHWRSAGVQSVPGFVVNGKHYISGGQTADAFETMLRKII